MTVFIFILVLVVLIVGHEFGHFIVAKLLKMRVLEFGIGFPPKIVGKKIGDTEYTINWLPFGGFVKILGEDEKGANADPRAMSNRPKAAQAAVIAAGPLANIVMAFVLFSLAFMIGTPQGFEGTPPESVHDLKVIVGEVLPGSPAEKAGIKAGDQVLAFKTPEALTDAIAHSTGPITLTVVREGKEITVTATPVAGIVPEEPERRAIGVATGLIGTVSLPFFKAIAAGAVSTVQSLWFIVVSLVTLIGGVFTLSANLAGVAGPVGIATLTGQAAAFGLGSLLTFAALLSVNLAVVNFLPFPALDGGRLVFLALEAASRKRIPPGVAHAVNATGFALLILLMLVITFHDVARLVG